MGYACGKTDEETATDPGDDIESLLVYYNGCPIYSLAKFKRSAYHRPHLQIHRQMLLLTPPRSLASKSQYFE